MYSRTRQKTQPFYTMILTVILMSILTLNVQAADINNHTEQQKKAIARVLFGELTDIKAVSKKVVDGAVRDEILIDVMAEKLAANYLNLLEHEIDTYAWMIKAIGESKDKRHRALMIEIQKSPAHPKLKKYVKKAIRVLKKRAEASPYIVGTVNLEMLADDLESYRPAPPKRPKGNLGVLELKQFHIANSNLKEIKIIAQGVAQGQYRELEITDALAEYLNQNYANAEEHQFDTLAWICRSFGTLADQRYLPLLRKIYASPDLPKKIQRHAKKAIKKLKRTSSSAAYVDGVVDLKALLIQFASE